MFSDALIFLSHSTSHCSSQVHRINVTAASGSTIDFVGKRPASPREDLMMGNHLVILGRFSQRLGGDSGSRSPCKAYLSDTSWVDPPAATDLPVNNSTTCNVCSSSVEDALCTTARRSPNKKQCSCAQARKRRDTCRQAAWQDASLNPMIRTQSSAGSSGSEVEGVGGREVGLVLESLYNDKEHGQ
jgi:hypothetical protein